MALRTEKDRAKAQQEKFQAILSGLLRDEDNKYCEDCDAKGPRWASWNLGIFLCIRCAGIHRNLGVHISRVKSVNLDSWTPEQIAMMQEMGNSRARAVYEANVPDTFRRPQTDSALEAFIRAKYEHKKYIAKEWVPPKPVVPKEQNSKRSKQGWLEDDKVDKKKTRTKPTSNISLNSGPPSSQSTSSSAASTETKAKAKPAAVVAAEPKPAQPQPPKPKSGSDDLLGLDAEVPQNAGSGQGGDLLADLFGGSPVAPAQGSGGEQNLMSAQQNGAAEADLFESGINGSGENQGEKKTAKDSIMALYGNSGGQQQMFGVPGCCFAQYTVAKMNTAEPSRPLSMPVGTGGMMASNMGMMVSNSGMLASNSGMGPGMLASSSTSAMASGIDASTHALISSVPNSGMASDSGLLLGQQSMLMPGMSASVGRGPSGGMAPSTGTTSKPALFPSISAMGPNPGTPHNAGASPMTGMAQRMGVMTANAAMSSSTRSVSSHAGSVTAAKPQQGTGVTSPSAWAGSNNRFAYPPGADFCQQYNVAPNLCYYTASGGMYMPQQPMYGSGAMPPMVQQQQGMMGQPIPQGMMGPPMQQGMMGMQQQPGGAMFAPAGQMGPGVMARPGGQMFMQQPQQQAVQQPVNPMQQQMQFQQMQQQMASMTMGGSQMGGMQQPQQVGGGSWGGPGTGQTLSTNLWQ